MKRLIALLLIALILVGCGSASADPAGITKQFVAALKEADETKLNALIVPDEVSDTAVAFEDLGVEDKETAKKFMSMLFQKEKVGTPVVTDNKAEVPVTWSAPDMTQLRGEFMTIMFTLAFDAEFTALPEEEQQKMVTDKLFEKMSETELKEYTSNLHLEKVDDKWMVNGMQAENENFLAPMFGEMIPQLP